MSELHEALDGLVRDAPLSGANWDDVVARNRRGARRRVPRRLAVAAALLALLALAGTAIAVGVGVNFVRQQERFHAQRPHDPQRVGPLVEVASGDGWALLAWRSNAGLCLDFAVPDNSPFACGLPVRGAGLSTAGPGAPIHAVDGFVSGSNLVGVRDSKTTVFGVAASDVAKVEVELADGQLVETKLFDAPTALQTDVRLFIVRVQLGALKRTTQRGARESDVHAFLAYDSDGRLIERVAV
jgi:hypothetical protein